MHEKLGDTMESWYKLHPLRTFVSVFIQCCMQISSLLQETITFITTTSSTALDDTYTVYTPLVSVYYNTLLPYWKCCNETVHTVYTLLTQSSEIVQLPTTEPEQKDSPMGTVELVTSSSSKPLSIV